MQSGVDCCCKIVLLRCRQNPWVLQGIAHTHVQVSNPSFESLCLTTNLDMPGLRLGLVAMSAYSRYM